MSKYFLILLFMFLLPGCAMSLPPEQYKLKVAEIFPHDANAYTQGLLFYNGNMYESSGQYGVSFFREVNFKNGTTVRSFNLAPKYFAEGAVVLNSRLYLLTWLEKVVFVYDLNTFKQLGTLYNPHEGWGLTTDGKHLIMSDGTSNIYFMDPSNFRELRKIEVSVGRNKITSLNELEYIEGDIWANVYGEDRIMIIDPETGNVKAIVDCKGLLHPSLRTRDTDVLNGIAYDPPTKSIYLTGKFWPKLFRIELVK